MAVIFHFYGIYIFVSLAMAMTRECCKARDIHSKANVEEMSVEVLFHAL